MPKRTKTRQAVDVTKCTGCGITKTLENTYRDKSKPDGLQTRCTACKAKRKAMHLIPMPSTLRCGLVEPAAPIVHRSAIFERDGKLWVSSLDVALNLEKEHDEVLRKIRDLDCTGAFTDRNFTASDYRDSTGRTLPAYNMTRDGFIFLASRFTGEKAARFMQDYIDRFNLMEEEIKKARDLTVTGELKAKDLFLFMEESRKTHEGTLATIKEGFQGMGWEIGGLKERMRDVEATQKFTIDELEKLKDKQGEAIKLLPLTRKKPSASDLRRHKEYVQRVHGSLCWICKNHERPVFDVAGRNTEHFSVHHFQDRHSVAFDQFGVGCKNCNIDEDKAKTPKHEYDGHKEGYLAGLLRYERLNVPRQLGMYVEFKK